MGWLQWPLQDLGLRSPGEVGCLVGAEGVEGGREEGVATHMALGRQVLLAQPGLAPGGQGVAVGGPAGLPARSVVPVAGEGMVPPLWGYCRAPGSLLPRLCPSLGSGGLELGVVGLSLAPPLRGGAWHWLGGRSQEAGRLCPVPSPSPVPVCPLPSHQL